MPPDTQKRHHHKHSPPDGPKRLPACDACKLRRVKCDPVLSPDSCSRCISKGITCTTTPVKRKSRTGTRIEAARAAFGARPGHEAKPAPLIRAESFIVQLEVSGELTAHLLEVHAFVTGGNLIAGNSLIPQFKASGRRLASLPRLSQTLTLCVLAISARISSHPLLFGSSAMPPRLATIIVDTSAVRRDSIPEWGRRRETACQRLREMAVESAWDAKLIRGDGDVSDEGLAACLMLGVIEERHEQGKGQLWTAAFISLLRRKIEAKHEEVTPIAGSDDVNDGKTGSFLMSTSSSVIAPDKLLDRAPSDVSDLTWSTHIMREALSSAARGQLCAYTLHDEELLTGLRPVDIEKVLAHSDTFGLAYSPYLRDSFEEEHVRAEWWDFEAYYSIIRPFTHRMTEVALRSYEWSLRRLHHAPFDVRIFDEHIASLVPLQKLLMVAGDRLLNLLSPMAVDMRRRVGRSASNSQRTDGTLTGSAPTPSDSPKSRGGMVMQGADGSDSIHSPMDELRAQEAARSLHLLLRGSMGASLFPIFNDLSERIQAIDNGCGFPRDNRELLVNMLDRVRRALLPQVLSMLRSISNTVHLAWVTSIGRSVRESGSHSGCSDWSASSSPEAEAHSPATVGSISSDPGPYSEDSDAVLGESELLFPSSLVWEGKLMSMFRTCISPHVFSRASWNEPFSIWARVLLDSPLAEDGRDGITRADRLFGLETVLDSVRVMSWAYPSLDDNFIRTLERSTEALKADGTHDGGTAISSSPSFSHDTPSTSSHSLLPRATTATSIPTLKEVLEGVPHERVSDVFFGGSGAGGLGMEGTDSARNAIEELSSDLRSFIIGDEANHRDANLEINGLAHTAPSATAETYSLHPSASPLIDVVLLSTPPGLSAFTLAVDHASVIDPIPDLTMLTQDKSLIAQPAFFPPSQSMPNDVSGNWVSEGFGAQGYNEQYDHRHHLPDHQVLQHPPAIQSMFLGRTHLPHTVDIAYEMSSGMPAAHSMSAVELEAEFQRLFDGRESTRDGAFDPSIWKGFDSQGVLDWGSV